MARLIRIDKDKKIETICKLLFEQLSPTELRVLGELVVAGGSLNISGNASKTIRNTLNLNESTFNVSIARLCKKGVIRRKNGVINLSPVFHDIENQNDFLIRFEAVTG